RRHGRAGSSRPVSPARSRSASFPSCPVTARTRLRKPLEIASPQLVLPRAQVVEILPGVDPRVVTVGERRPQCIVPDRLDACDGHVALPGLQRLLAGAVAAHLGGRRMHPQEFVRQPEMAAVGERDLEDARRLVELDLGGRDVHAVARRKAKGRPELSAPILPDESIVRANRARETFVRRHYSSVSGTMSRLPMPENMLRFFASLPLSLISRRRSFSESALRSASSYVMSPAS